MFPTTGAFGVEVMPLAASLLAEDTRDQRLGQARGRAHRDQRRATGIRLSGGHIAYVWINGRATYIVSLHGYTNERVRPLR